MSNRINNPLVSIIVPVYNAENFISKCIDSILNQTYRNIEVILVNDGSTDSSLSILESYQKKFPEKIFCFSQKNKGEGETRNVGISHSSGDYIALLDSDDWYDLDYIETLLKEIGNNDILVSGMRRFDAHNNFKYNLVLEDNEWNLFKNASIAGKFYKADFIKDNNLNFEKLLVGADTFFNIKSYSLTDKVVLSSYSGYCYYENTESVTRDKTYNPKRSFMVLIDKIENEVNLSKFKFEYVYYFYLKNIILQLIFDKSYFSVKECYKRFKANMHWLRDVSNKHDNDLFFFNNKFEDNKINFVVNCVLLIYKIKLSKLFIKLIKNKKININ